MRSETESHAILERALTAANTAEADATFISTDQNISRFANSGVHQNMSEISAALTVRVIVDGCMGVASTSSLDDDGIANAAALAHEAARHAGALQNFSGLYRDNEATPLLTTFDPKTAAVSPIAKARALREMFDRGREHGVHFAGSYGTGGSSVACANTHGVRRYATMSSAEATVIAIRGGESGYATAVARH
ncbi:MAG TPA: DNA gyrase modulator, partial [Thermoanaerobaculia bacterium]|nr:DNA gyrase modulator [Thermoanaerobaculia bacterium]